MHDRQVVEGRAALLGRAGLVGLEGSCSPSWTGSRGEDVGLKRGKMEGKVMRRRGECLLPACLDDDPALAIPTHETGTTTSWAKVCYEPPSQRLAVVAATRKDSKYTKA